MSLFKSLFIAGIIIGLIISCRNDNMQSITPAIIKADTVPDVVTLSIHVNKIFNVYQCTSSRCHGSNPGAGEINLIDYNKLKVIATSGQLYGAISHAPSYSPMPKTGGKLTNVELETIKKWIDNGAPNN